MDPAHGGAHWDGNELGLVGTARWEDCQHEAGFRLEPHLVEAVVDVMLVQGWWSMPWVSVSG